MNTTAEYPNLDYYTESTPRRRLTGFVTPMSVGLHKLEDATRTREALSATPLTVEDGMEIEEFLWRLQTRHNYAELYDEDIEYIGGQARFFEYAIGSGTAILVDLWEVSGTPEAEFDAEYEQVIDELRNGNREVLAEELIEMLRNSREDPDEVEIKLLSLQAMARFLIRQREFDDPVAGPDPSGIVQIEWHILGNGLLVMAFLEDDRVHCVVQTDATSEREMLNENAQLTESEALERFGYLVPRR